MYVVVSAYLTLITTTVHLYWQILTKDSVTVAVDAVVYYRISDPTMSVINVEKADQSTRLLAQTTLRNFLGTKNLADVLADREEISHSMQVQYGAVIHFIVLKI